MNPTAILACLGLLALATTATAVPPPLYPGDPGGTCVGDYNPQATANLCVTPTGPSNFLVPIYVLPGQTGSVCLVGGICAPFYTFEIIYGAPLGQAPAGIYAEAACNQPAFPCGCTAPYAIEVCAPIIAPN